MDGIAASATPAPRSRSGAAFPGHPSGLLSYHAQTTVQSLELLDAPAEVGHWGQTLSTWAMGSSRDTEPSSAVEHEDVLFVSKL